MTNTKTFMLAAAAALSLGIGSAMAQESADGSFMQGQPTTAPGQRSAPLTVQPQAGSSDVEQTRTPVSRQQPNQVYLLGADAS